MRFGRILFIAAISSGLLSCSKVEKSSTVLQTTEEGSTSDLTAGAPLYLVLQSLYDTAASSALVTEGSCITSSTNKNLTCAISIPESRLYYSSLKFKIGVGSKDACSLVTFRPYYFKRASISYRFPGQAADTDCTDSKQADCYGGAAKNILKNANISFPANTGVYFLTANVTDTTYTLDSSNSRRSSETADASLTTNVNSCNNLISRGGVQYNDGVTVYEGGNKYYDYLISCEDDYGNVNYSITLTISDKDTVSSDGGITNDYYDWN